MKDVPYFATAFLFITNSPPINKAGTSSFLPEPPLIKPPDAYLEPPKILVIPLVALLNKFFKLVFVNSAKKSSAAFDRTSAKSSPFRMDSTRPSIIVSLNFSAEDTSVSPNLSALS